MSPARSLNHEIEGLRGLACIMVALSHVFFVTPLDPSVTLPTWLHHMEAGHAGVLIFFMLSGYVIGWTNFGSWSPAGQHAYLRRRILRLVPIYYVSLALTAAVSLLLQDSGQVPVLVASAFGLQNLDAYFGLKVNVPLRNSALWSLNYELLYYAVFLALWRWQPRLGWIIGPALVATTLSWCAPSAMPVFLGSYSCGWVFWAAGWQLARLPERPVGAPPLPVLTWVLLAYAAHEICGVLRILNALGLHNTDSGMVSIGNLGLFPPIVLLLAAVSNRQLPYQGLFSALAWLLCLVPLAGMLWTGRLWSQPNWVMGGGAVLLAAACLGVRTSGWLRWFGWIGGISYAFYVVHFPLLFALERLPLPRGTLLAYSGRVLVWLVLALALSWFLERHFQAWIRTRFTPANPIPT